ncbi:MAG: universal stress protein [Myxococcales bacterium]|nr:universal stress protein [Myxococcales bacterium]
MELSRVLVPVDFSRHSEGALRYGLVLAERLGGRVHVMHATTAPSHLSSESVTRLVQGSAVVTVEDLAREDAEAQMGPLLARVGPSPVPLSSEVVFDDPLAAVLEREHEADLVVLGTHGRRGFERWVMGSLAEKALRAVTAPLITYRWPPEVAEPRPGVPRRILVPVDFSRCARTALALAGQLAAACGAELDLVHVIRHVSSMDGPRGAPFLAEARRQAEEEIAAFLAEIPEHEHVRVEVGDPGHEVVRAADEGGYDLVVMGTHGRSGVERLVLGSVAERVARHAPCPVLTLRSRIELGEDGWDGSAGPGPKGEGGPP